MEQVLKTSLTMGTALTKEHIALIKRLSYYVTLCFDGDKAGEKATLSAGDELFKNGFNVKVVRLSDEMDPDEFILKYGPERFQLVLEQARSWIDYKIDYYKSTYNINDSTGAAKFIENILKDVVYIDDAVLKQTILNKISQEVGIGLETLNQLLKEEKATENVSVKQEVKIAPKKKTRYDRAENSLLYYKVQSERVIDIVDKRGVFFTKKEHRYLANEIIYFYKENGKFILADFLSYLNDKKELAMPLAMIMNESLPNEFVDQEIYDNIEVLKKYNTKEEAKRLKSMLVKEIDPIKKAEIAMRVVELERGSLND